MPTMRVLSLPLVLTAAGCAGLDSQPSAPFELDAKPRLTIGVETSETGEEAYEFSRVNDTYRFADGRIAVGNANPPEFRLFDAAGKHIKNVGRMGGGPGEFAEFSAPALYPYGTRFIGPDGGAFRFHLYDSDLKYLETRRFATTPAIGRPFLRGAFADGSFLVLAFGGGGMRGEPGTIIRSNFSLLRYDSSGAVMDSIATFGGRDRYVNKVGEVTHYPFIPFTTEPIEGIVGNSVVVLRGDKPELEYYDLKGKVTRVARWSRERVKSSALIDAYKKAEFAGFAPTDVRNRTLYEAFYKKDLPLPEYAPLYRVLKVDAANRVWLERFRMPGDTARRQWDVISAEGQWLGVMSTPARLTIHRIGTDYLLGRSLDSLGVERVELYGLRARR